MTVPRQDGRCLIMGILNVTSDSFSDGGRWDRPDSAVSHAQRLVRAGADIVDVGGESTRPGAHRTAIDVERRRVLPVIERLAASGMRVSVDTMRSEIASLAVSRGATIVNDVSGGLADPRMLSTVADIGATLVLTHWRAHASVAGCHATYEDVVDQVRSELGSRCDAATLAGVDPSRIVIDPGLGFSKESKHNWDILAALDVLQSLGFPVLIGGSRKRFLIQDAETTKGSEMDERDVATAALTALVASRGVWGVRVHDVRRSRIAANVAASMALT